MEDSVMGLSSLYAPAPHVKRLPSDQVAAAYQRHRFRNFSGIFIGYASYYLLRENFALAMPYLLQEGKFPKAKLGLILSGVTLTYGISKFIMGNISDRSNPRYFLATGIAISVMVNFIFSLLPGVTESLVLMFALMLVNGWAQGMGAPPCYRTVSHWFSVSERGRTMAVWNTAHNIGAGLLGASAVILTSSNWLAWPWKSIFFVPATFSLMVVGLLVFLMSDTPQSVGLPPIEEYKNEYPPIVSSGDYEKELSGKEILFKYVLKSKFVWFLAMANIFVYFVRYGVLYWAPTYLSEIKGVSASRSGWSFFSYELAGMCGMIICGYLSDKLKNKRGIVNIFCMLVVCGGVLLYWLSPNVSINHAALSLIGMFIYGSIMLIGVQVLDLVHKKAVGTTIGLLGLFGYGGGTMSASLGFGYLVDIFGWQMGFIALVIACFLATLFFSLTLIKQTTE